MLTITVSGSYPGRASEFWPAIDRAIGALVGESDGRVTRISREDGGANYRDYGTYNLTYSAKWSEHEVRLVLA